MIKIPGGSRAKGDHIICPFACKRTRRIIVCVAIRFRTRRLEHLRVLGRPARRRRRERAAAAVLRPPERVAGAPARLTFPHPQLRRAPPVQVGHAAGGGTLAGAAAGGRHCHREVVTVHEADVVEVPAVAGADGELGEGGRRGGACAVALELAGAAVTGGARAFAGGVEVAGCPAPEAAGPAGRSLECAGGASGELEAGTAQALAAGVG